VVSKRLANNKGETKMANKTKNTNKVTINFVAEWVPNALIKIEGAVFQSEDALIQALELEGHTLKEFWDASCIAGVYVDVVLGGKRQPSKELWLAKK
jgi:hypothetical protein